MPPGADVPASASADGGLRVRGGPRRTGSEASPEAAATPTPAAGDSVPADSGAPSLVVLSYLNRSGSTFLARLLSEYEDVAVSLEAQFDDGLVRASRRIANEADLDALLADLAVDPKFSGWGVDSAALKARLAPAGYPVTYPAFLRAALSEALGDDARVHLYKNGRYLEQPEAFRRQFPDAKMIFVLRDPRAVFASQKRSLDSRTGDPMSSQPAFTARWFRRMVETLDRLADAPWLCVVRYEDLLARPADECGRVLDFLGASRRRRADGTEYADRIPEAQRHLHQKVGGAADPKRLEAWRTELTAAEIAAIDAAAGDTLARAGYEPASPHLSPAARLQAAWLQWRGLSQYTWARLRWNLVTKPRR